MMMQFFRTLYLAMLRFLLLSIFTVTLSACGGTSVQLEDQEDIQPLPEDSIDIFATENYPILNAIFDPLYEEQWHLQSTGNQTAFSGTTANKGHDINIADLWQQGIDGRGVKIAVVDTGVEYHHPDLEDNILLNLSWNYKKNINNPSPNGQDSRSAHGTSVTGIIAALANEQGGVGIAPHSKIMGFDWLDTNQNQRTWVEMNGGARTQHALIINKSFGVETLGPAPFFDVWNSANEEFLAKVTRINNQGLGVLLVKAAGNANYRTPAHEYKFKDKQLEYVASVSNNNLSIASSNLEPESSSFYHTVVGAISHNAHFPLALYSSTGSSLWVSAPGGMFGIENPAIITTDLIGCDSGASSHRLTNAFDHNRNGKNPNCHDTSTFTGTSAAAPMVSGVAALIWQANHTLTWRDVRHILATTARKIDPHFAPIKLDNSDFTAEPGWVTNKAGFSYHNWYGFGLVDAQAAVNMARSKDYLLLPDLKETSFIPTSRPLLLDPLSIPDDINNSANLSFEINNDLIIESVQLKLSITHARDADLAIELTSPSGTTSMVLQPQTLILEDQLGDTEANFNNSVLASHAFYGELAAGTWTLTVTDTHQDEFCFHAFYQGQQDYKKECVSNPTSISQITNAGLRIYGHSNE